MVDQAPEFETIDRLGDSKQYAGTVGASPVQVPAVAGFDIDTFLISCPGDNTPVTKRLSWSLDNVTYHVLRPGEDVPIKLKNSYKQIYLKGNVADVSYEMFINYQVTT